jgi:holo-[acyl-carrier protein] synthase
MIIGIGIDISSQQRIKQSIAQLGDKFLQRILTARELAQCQTIQDSIARYTGRFAAKEAFMKAIAISNTKVGFHEIEIFNHENGAPYIVTSKRATDILAQLMVNQIHISISHDADVAVAVVILER